MIEIKKVENSDIYSPLRIEIFIKEQGFSKEFDDLDKISTHLVLFKDKKPVGYLRIYRKREINFIGRVCVLKEFRRKGYASKLLKEAENYIKSGLILVLSQHDKVELYEKNGYSSTNEIEFDEGIKHIYLKKNI